MVIPFKLLLNLIRKCLPGPGLGPQQYFHEPSTYIGRSKILGPPSGALMLKKHVLPPLCTHIAWKNFNFEAISLYHPCNHLLIIFGPSRDRSQTLVGGPAKKFIAKFFGPPLGLSDLKKSAPPVLT